MLSVTRRRRSAFCAAFAILGAGIALLALQRGDMPVAAEEPPMSREAVVRSEPTLGAPPSWNGLTLGRATEADALHLLGKADEEMRGEGFVLYRYYADDAHEFSATVGIWDGAVQQIELTALSDEDTLAKVEKKYGTAPLTFGIEQEPEGDVVYYDRYLAYPKQGLAFSEDGSFGDVTKLIVSPVALRALQDAARDAS